MKYHQGRLIDHIGVNVSDFETSKAFYVAILDALGKSDGFGCDDSCFWFDELYVAQGDPPVTNLHLAFQAYSKEQVQAFYETGLAAGGKDNGAPGYRSYHKHYYAAFLLDPDGNNVEAVCDVGAERSSDSVIVSRDPGND